MTDSPAPIGPSGAHTSNAADDGAPVHSGTHPRPGGPRRRSVVAVTAAATALLPLAGSAAARQSTAGQLPYARDDSASEVFAHGVASGDPLPDGILLWTRVTPSADALPGSGNGAATRVSWQVAEDGDFRTVVADGSSTATADSDHTVKADIRGLRPATTYYFRFAAAGVNSATGRTRTAPADGAEVPRLRFGVVCCANYDNGYFGAYRHLAQRTDLDAVLHLGDYIYEYEPGKAPEKDQAVRFSEPPHETVSLADYRLRHATYKTDADLRAVHAAHPLIAVWDDHEIANDAWSGGAENHTESSEGSYATRLHAAKQAYFEWLPVRPSTAGSVYRRLGFGKLAELFLLDLRSFRDQQAKLADRDTVADPERSITGRKQLDWLKSGLAGSSSTWRLVGSSVMVTPVAFGTVPPQLLKPLADLFGVAYSGLAINVDTWDGYAHDQQELLTHLRQRHVANTVFLAGDIHMAWANEVPVSGTEPPGHRPVATEFVVTSATSDNVDDMLKVPPHTTSTQVEQAVVGGNRHVKWLDADSHGYSVLELTAHQAQMDFFVLSDRKDPNATVSLARSYRTRSGSHRLERTDQPVR